MKFQNFSVVPERSYINNKGFKEYRLEVKPVSLNDDDEIPPSILKTCVLTITPNVDSMPSVTLNVIANMIDVSFFVLFFIY
jgi:hypothetical protein